jgi:hypothetical protein
MKALTTFVSAAVVAVTISAASMPAHAAVFAQFQPLTNAADYKWVRNGAGGSFFTITSNSDTSAQAVNIAFQYLAPAYAAGITPTPFAALSATLNVHATAANVAANVATEGDAGTWTQPGLVGGFEILYTGPDQTLNGFHLVAGENLLSGTFSNAWIQGAGGSGSTNVTIGNGGSASYTSDIVGFANVIAGSQEFAFNLLSTTPSFGAAAGQGLTSFRSNGGGNFAANGIPEPATWALMIMGFGGVGALLRSNRRRQVTATA